jgi:hypothetical protein
MNHDEFRWSASCSTIYQKTFAQFISRVKFLPFSLESFCRILVFLLALSVRIHGQSFISFEPHSNECALTLAGEGRSSLYDYNVNLFRGTL